MIQTKIAIIGAGLSGLYAAYLLEQAKITNYVVLEARDRLGGRVYSEQGFDLGATWIWPELNPELMQLVYQLKLPFSEQFEKGKLVFERQRGIPPVQLSSPWASTPSIRLEGGMSSLVHGLAQQIPAQKILTQQQVTHITQQEQVPIHLSTQNPEGSEIIIEADYVLIALAPRLTAQHILFNPTLPPVLLNQWKDTATWMAPHAKYVAIYSEAFWKKQGLSGQASSHVGPMGEIHDASTSNSHAALFGFLGIPASIRKKVSEADLMAHCRAQLVRLFGSEAATPEYEYIKDWSADNFTATDDDWKTPAVSHGIVPANTPNDQIWHNRIIGIASEWSQHYSGYLAGAIDAAQVGVQRIQQLL
ncbi:flavin monoamine oxidase family protein [Acinetobacter nematophilus]|uniref:FAD-dependent oxidoreductase n=1 Tax=Acinetobacter nematophilus TaxID=2994642 RepID=A0A9X3DRT7_9GAMM|nr:FAD-dependent oxidoreductase [Acinetobacter nematophilus]MCX5467248.1 FAD-dependent oxidoreductase [Acinetobacter nematophilus]